VAGGGVASPARDPPPESPSSTQRESDQLLPWWQEARQSCRLTSASVSSSRAPTARSLRSGASARSSSTRTSPTTDYFSSTRAIDSRKAVLDSALGGSGHMAPPPSPLLRRAPPAFSSLMLPPILPTFATWIPHTVLQTDPAGLRRRWDGEKQHRGVGRIPSKGARPPGAATAGQRWGWRRMEEAPVSLGI
jgi:hypothetical protein